MKSPAYFLILYLGMTIMFGCVDNNRQEEKAAEPDLDDLISLHELSEFSLSFRIPSSWVSSPVSMNPMEKVSFYADTTSRDILPYRLNAPMEAAYMTVFPRGYGTELPSGRSKALKGYSFWDPEESLAFLLSNGTPWAYFLKPAEVRGIWNQEGFVFLQLPVTGSMRCENSETGNDIPMEDCEPLLGDIIIRTGELPPGMTTVADSILSSFAWEMEEERPLPDLIRTEQPLPNKDVRSPLTIKGEARGSWFSEGSFYARLIDKDGNQLAEGSVRAKADWMTEDWVPFETTLTFESPGNERGHLILEKANPSGLPENERELQIPVIFN